MKYSENELLRKYAHEKNIPLWRIGKHPFYNCHENTMIRKLREPFTSEQAEMFRSVVDEIAFADSQKGVEDAKSKFVP